ncbi:MAG: hypothetical protein J6P72_02915 [Firmicutes bacterium]|nr:hypothetical protein [Bacillota bacterium]
MLPRNFNQKPELPATPPKKSLFVISLLLIVVGLAGVIATVVLSTSVRNQPAQELSQLQKDHQDQTGQYAKVTAVKYYQFLAAIQNSTENYFFVTDPSGRAYIVRISTEDAQSMIDAIADGYAAEMYGILHETGDDLKKEAINGAKALFDEMDELSEDNFTDYFGSTYLGFNEIPTHPLGSVFGTLGTFMTVVGMMFLIFYMNRKLRSREQKPVSFRRKKAKK